MNISTAARLGIAGAVAGAGLAAGGIAVASAESSTADTSASAGAHPGGPRGDRGQTAEVLAQELGLDEGTVQKALDTARDEIRPDPSGSSDDKGKRTPPTAKERTERQAALVTALAKALDVSEAKVEAALDVAQKQSDADRQDRRAESRVDLVARLESAVTAGTLTEADQASVLKAFDAELLGGPGGGGRGPAESQATS